MLALDDRFFPVQRGVVVCQGQPPDESSDPVLDLLQRIDDPFHAFKKAAHVQSVFNDLHRASKPNICI